MLDVILYNARVLRGKTLLIAWAEAEGGVVLLTTGPGRGQQGWERRQRRWRTNSSLGDKFWQKLHINSQVAGWKYSEECWTQTQNLHDWQRLPVTDIDLLSQTQTVCDRHRLPVTNKLSVTHTDYMRKTKNVRDRHRLSMTDTDCIWQTQTVCDNHMLHTHNFFSWNIHKVFFSYFL